MSQHTATTAHPAGPSTAAALRRAAGTRRRVLLLTTTPLLGALAAAALAAGLPAGQRTFAAVSATVQLLMSVPLPFTGVLLATDLRRSPGAAPGGVLPTLAAAVLLAGAVGLAGALLAALALLAAGSGAADPWASAVPLVAGGVLVQVVAQLVGTGLGLLVRRPALASLGTVVLPLGVYALLGAVEVLRPAREWLTPYATSQDLLSGRAGPVDLAREGVVVLLWCAGLNALGAARLRRDASPRPSPALPQG
ncbi:hypothetical protein [Kineococcus sp. NUM-3379]